MKAKQGKTYIIKYKLNDRKQDPPYIEVLADFDIRGYDPVVFIGYDGIVYRTSDWEIYREIIRISLVETQSGHNRVDWAESLIVQLPKTHEGRNSWLLNYGKNTEAIELRVNKDLVFDGKTQRSIFKG